MNRCFGRYTRIVFATFVANLMILAVWAIIYLLRYFTLRPLWVFG